MGIRSDVQLPINRIRDANNDRSQTELLYKQLLAQEKAARVQKFESTALSKTTEKAIRPLSVLGVKSLTGLKLLKKNAWAWYLIFMTKTCSQCCQSRRKYQLISGSTFKRMNAMMQPWLFLSESRLTVDVSCALRVWTKGGKPVSLWINVY